MDTFFSWLGEGSVRAVRKSEEEDIPNAWEELLRYLHPGEEIEWIIFGEVVSYILGIPRDPFLIPKEKCHVLLDPGDAEPLMKGWTFQSYPSPGQQVGHAFQVWTDRRILRTHILGSNRPYQVLCEIPRNPESARISIAIEIAQCPPRPTNKSARSLQ